MSLAHLRPRTAGEILDGAFVLYRTHFALLVLTGLALYAPVQVLIGISMGLVPRLGAGLPGTVVFTMLLSLAGSAAGLVAWAALTRVASDAVLGRAPTFEDASASGFRAFLPLLGAAALVTIAGMVLTAGLAFVSLLADDVAAAAGRVAVMMASALFFAAAVTLGAAAGAMCFAVLPAVVVERKGPVAALKRSRELAAGAWPQILGVSVVSTLIVVLPSVAAMAAFGTLPGGRAAPGGLPLWRIVLQQAGGALVGCLTIPFLAASLTLLYYDRRVRTEALDLEVAADALAVPT